MKSKYAIFNESGAFVRFESIDPQEVPAIPLADDGQPRAVAVPTEPELPAGKAHVFGRAGWIEVDAEPALGLTDEQVDDLFREADALV